MPRDGGADSSFWSPIIPRRPCPSQRHRAPRSQGKPPLQNRTVVLSRQLDIQLARLPRCNAHRIQKSNRNGVRNLAMDQLFPSYSATSCPSVHIPYIRRQPHPRFCSLAGMRHVKQGPVPVPKERRAKRNIRCGCKISRNISTPRSFCAGLSAVERLARCVYRCKHLDRRRRAGILFGSERAAQSPEIWGTSCTGNLGG